MKARPCVWVSGPDRGGWPMWAFTRFALWRAGARAVRLTPSRVRGEAGLKDLAARQGCGPDAIVLGGGADVASELYDPDGQGDELMDELGEARRRSWREFFQSLLVFPLVYLVRKAFSLDATKGVDRERDELECALLHLGLTSGVPILGVCRGAQLLNVYLGGTLHRQLNDFYEEHPKIRSVLPRKRVAIAPDSCLFAFMGKTARVNALHDQAIDRLGEGLMVAAQEESGVVQAVVHTTHPFIVGVQWHPEFLPQKVEQRGLWRTFVTTALALETSRADYAVSLPDTCPVPHPVLAG